MWFCCACAVAIVKTKDSITATLDLSVLEPALLSGLYFIATVLMQDSSGNYQIRECAQEKHMEQVSIILFAFAPRIHFRPSCPRGREEVVFIQYKQCNH